MLSKIYFLITIPIMSFITFLGFAGNTFGGNLNYEKVFVHINRNVLLSGSQLKYAAYISNESNGEVSSIIYFEVIDCNGTALLNWKSKTHNHFCFGFKIIPESINSGLYYLRAYTNKTRNYPPAAIFTTPLIIQRIYEDTMDTLCIPKSVTLPDTISTLNNLSNKWINIKTEELAEFKMTLQPDNTLYNAEVSISVTELPDMKLWNKLPDFESYTNNTKEVLQKNNPLDMPAENKFTIISGKVFYLPDSTPVAKKYIYLAYPDSTIHFKYFNTTNNGEFCFLLDSTFDNKQIYLQVFDLECKKDSLAWEIDDKSLLCPPINDQENIRATEKQQAYIDQIQKREIISRVYQPVIQIQNIVATTNFIPNIFQKPSYLVKPSDYVELTNFQDICDNILPSVRFKVTNNKVQIGVVINQQVIFNDVLICVDGLPCFNMNYIENLSSKDIKQIEIFNEVLLYGNLTYNGVIAIYTNKKEVDERAFCNPYTVINNHFYSCKNKTFPNNTKSNSPMVNPDIYWNPSLQITDSEVKEISFPKPEIGTRYLITINGLVNGTFPFGYEKLIIIEK